MNRQRHMTSFYLETVLMIIIFVLVIAVLAQVFSLARSQSREAEELTNAVCLAQNAAEAVAAADSQEALARLLDENGNTVLEESAADAATVTAYYDREMQPVAAEAAEAAPVLRVETSWDPEASARGTYVNSNVAVYSGNDTEPLYTLQTGVYIRENQPAEQDEEQEAAR